MATVNTVRVSPHDVEPSEEGTASHIVHLNEKKVFLANQDENEDAWVLDTGASNHMTGCCEVLSSLDTWLEAQFALEMVLSSISRASDRCCCR